MAQNQISVKANGYSNDNAYIFRITADLTGNISGNNREVRVDFDVYATNPGGYTEWSTPRAYIIVDNQAKTDMQIRNIWPRGTWVNIGSWIGYVSAGQTVTITGRYNSNTSESYMPLNGNKDVVVSLNIPGVASTITSSSSLTYNVGSDIQLGVSKYVNEAIDKLEIKYNDTILFSDNDYTNGKLISPIASALTTIYNSTSELSTIPLVATLTTYVNGSQLGTPSVLNFNGTMSNDIRINSVSYKDKNTKIINNLTHDETVIVKDISNVEFDIDYTLLYSGQLKSIYVNGELYSSEPLTINNYNKSNALITLQTKRLTQKSFAVDFIELNKWINYQKPTLNVTSCKRNTNVDGKVNIKLDGTWFNGNFSTSVPNTLNLYYRSKIKGSENFSNWISLPTPTKNGNTYFLQTQLTNFNYQNQYEFEFAVLDKYYDDYSFISSASIPKGVTLWDLGEHDAHFRVPVYIDGEVTSPTITNMNTSITNLNTKVNNLIDYTSGEVVVGTFSGKPIYRNIFSGTRKSVNSQVSALNIETVVYAIGKINSIYSNNWMIPNNYVNETGYQCWIGVNGNIETSSFYNDNSTVFYYIIEYTKK